MSGKPIQPVRVMIVDDHAVVREGLRNFLGMVPGIRVTGEAASGAEALDVVVRAKPQVVLMDLVIPGMDGIETTRKMHQEHPEVAIIVLTSFAEDDKLFPAIRAGAASYLLKDVGPRELADTILAAARGEVRLPPEVARRLVSGIAEGAEKRVEEILTARELDVLRCLGRGRSNKEIAEELFISEKTVKTHVSAILDKLSLSDRTQAALYAAKRGLT